MNALFWRSAILAAAALSLGAGYRTQNFIVTTNSPALAREIGDAAEAYRKNLAWEWLGHELPPWPQPCPITVQAAPHLGAGGATSFMFEGRQPFGWRMSIQGSRERLLDSVLPHEVTHTIFASHFGRPLPRWADEGACTTVEHPSEIAKQQQFLQQFLRCIPPRSIPFNKMFRMTEYPHDIMPLYSQGHSVAQFLIEQGGKRKFIEYVGRGMDTSNWDRATDEYYGFKDLSELQLDWVDWVAQGSPRLDAGVDQLANNPDLGRRAQPVDRLAMADSTVPRREVWPGENPMSSATEVAGGNASRDSQRESGETGSWYARQRHAAGPRLHNWPQWYRRRGPTGNRVPSASPPQKPRGPWPDCKGPSSLRNRCWNGIVLPADRGRPWGPPSSCDAVASNRLAIPSMRP